MANVTGYGKTSRLIRDTSISAIAVSYEVVDM